MEDLVLTPDEQLLVRASLAGEEANFESRSTGDTPGGVIRASILRRLMLGLPIIFAEGEDETIVHLPGPGVRIVKAHIQGKLNLEYGCMSNGEELPRLSMERCYIPQTILLRSARLRRLCLYGSKISMVLAHEAYISGQLDIREVESANVEKGCQGKGMCRFGLRGAHIEDGIDARRAKLASDSKRDGYVKYAARARYALDLAEARIEGDVRLFPDFEAFGGVNLNGAQVRGSIQAHGAVITAEEMYAFDVSNARIEGRIALDSRQGEDGRDSVRFRGGGEFRFYNTELTASLNMAGAEISGPIKADLLKAQGDVIFAAYIGTEAGKSSIMEFLCLNKIELRGARIGGSLNCQGGHLMGGLDASNTQIQCHALFCPHHAGADQTRFLSLDPLTLEGTHIAGDLNLEGARLNQGMNANGVRIDGYCKMGFHAKSENCAFEAGGVISLNDAFVGFDLDMSGAHLTQELRAPNIQIGGKLKICAAEWGGRERPFIAEQRINLSGAQIRNDFYLTKAILRRGLRFRGGLVKSCFFIDVDGGRPYVTPEHTYKSSIDLVNTHASIVTDSFNGKLLYGTTFTLNLEGFTYDRFLETRDIESFTDEESERPVRRWKLQKKGRSAREWKKWLRLQYENGKPDSETYSPTPYNTLFRVMKSNGMTDEADKVLKEKLRVENELRPFMQKIIPVMHGFFFQFGLSPLRATATYIVYIAIVSSFILFANTPPFVPRIDFSLERSLAQSWGLPALPDYEMATNVLVVRAQTDAGIRVLQPSAPVKTEDFISTLTPADNTYLTNVPCAQRINAFLYALDMIIPVIDLGQKSKCDFADNSPVSWKTFKAIATVLGWIITSLVILTWSGVIRRRTEPTV